MRRSTFCGLVATVALTGIVGSLGTAPLALGASAPKPHFKALYWRVWVPDSTGYARPHKVKSSGHYTLCNMDQLNELEVDYSYSHAVAHGLPYAMTIAGPGGAEKMRFHTKQATGRGTEGWGAGALPPMFTTPTQAGKYTVTIRQSSKVLMRTSITLASSNTCS